MQRPGILLPTGAGKTRIFAALTVIEEASHRRRPLILCNRDELVGQNAAAVRRAARPHQKVGIVQASVDQSRDSHIVVASVQTISRANRLARFDPKRFDLIVLDEVHLADNPSWRRVIEYFGGFDAESGTRVVGVTATLAKTGRHKLGEIVDEIVFERDVRWGIQEGWLTPVSALTVTLPDLDLDHVAMSRGDFQDGDLGKAMAQAKAGHIIAAAYNEHCRDENGELRRGVLFAPTIECAESFMEDFRLAGIPTELVIGSTPIAERQAKYEATRRGTNKVLSSVGCLTTGFDLPSVSCVVMARPTKAVHLYVQCVGRGLRQSPETGKTDCLILDTVGATRLGLASIADLRIHEDQDPGDNVAFDELELDVLRRPKPELDVPVGAEFHAVDPFSGLRKQAKRNAERFKKNFLWTNGGVMFLPMVDGYIALSHQDDGLWTVCEVPHRGSTVCQYHDMTLAAAMDQAAEMWGSAPKALQGMASDEQMMYLVRLGVEFEADTLTKQQASDLISIAKASKRLDS